MQLQVMPPPSEVEVAAIERALRLTGAQLEVSPAYGNPWRRAALREAVEGLPVRPSYALSPRSTRGATRA